MTISTVLLQSIKSVHYAAIHWSGFSSICTMHRCTAAQESVHFQLSKCAFSADRVCIFSWQSLYFELTESVFSAGWICMFSWQTVFTAGRMCIFSWQIAFSADRVCIFSWLSASESSSATIVLPPHCSPVFGEEPDRKLLPHSSSWLSGWWRWVFWSWRSCWAGGVRSLSCW